MAGVDKSASDGSDGLKLLGSAVLVILLGISNFALANRYHISAFAVFLGWMAVAFFAVIGKDFRGQLKQPFFLAFFVSWLFVHLLVCVFFLAYFSILHWAVAMIFEVALGYWLAHEIFKVPYPWDVEKHSADR